LGCTLKELLLKIELWELLGLLYASQWWQKTQNEAYEKAKHENEIKQKLEDGKMNRYFKGKRK